jgi:hypothetical protein
MESRMKSLSSGRVYNEESFVEESCNSFRAGTIIYLSLAYSQANSEKSYAEEREKRREKQLVATSSAERLRYSLCFVGATATRLL